MTQGCDEASVSARSLRRFNGISGLLSLIVQKLQVPRDNPELLQAMLTAFSRQVPLMYILLITNTLALSVAHYGTAPVALTVYVPATLGTLCFVRLVTLWRCRHRVFTVDQAVRRLQTVLGSAVGLGIGFAAWSLSLFSYGDAYAQGQVAFFMAVTVIGCVFCLMHLRTAAFTVMLLVTIPFVIFFGSTGNGIFIAIAINLAMVMAVVAIMITVNYRDFERRVNSEKALRVKQAELQNMSDINFNNAHFDSLTGLPNRRSFFAELERRITRTEASGGSFALAVLDLDGFKSVNDVYGHRVGDQLLHEAALRLRGKLPPSTFLARVGGDEFVIICDDTAQGCLETSERVSDFLSEPFAIGQRCIRVGCSIGVAICPSAATTAEGLFERADYALYFAKENNRGKAALFSADHEASIRQASLIDQALLNVDLERELWVEFQPIVDTDTGRPVAFEALARWSSPTLGNVPPIQFINAAERSGSICKLTPILLRKALEAASHWPHDVRISFNLSTLDVGSPLSIIRIMNIVERSGFDPARIDFEITETTVMRNLQQAAESLVSLKTMGVQISLDDFGTGYSSLSCIRELPLDKVKIDRSFIFDLESSSRSRTILRTVVELCDRLGLDSVAEGVETAEQMKLLRSKGCRFMQGYYFARPMRGDRIADYLAGCRSTASKSTGVRAPSAA